MDAEFDVAGLPSCSVAEWLLGMLRKHAAEKGKIAQIFADDGSSWTYEQLLKHSVQVAVGLQSLGAKDGDVLSLVARNSHELYALAFGCFMSGVIVTPSIAELPPKELRQNFETVRPKFVIAGEPSLASVQEAASELARKPQIFEIKQFFKDMISNGSHTDPATFKPVHVSDPGNHVFLCMFSSGTTGKQKAVAMNDLGVLRTLHITCLLRNVGVGPVIYTSQANWGSSWTMTIASLIWDWTRIIMNNVDFKDKVSNLLDAIQEFKPAVFYGPPPLILSMIHKIDENPGRWDLSSLTTFLVGGDKMDKLAHERFSKKFSVKIYQGYGTTEVGHPFMARTDSPIVYGSVGTPLVPAKLVDVETGEEIREPNKPGEIFVKWFHMKEYYNNPEETAKAFDENGWFKTGDIAIFDESGNHYIVDRVKEMFRYCGVQIAPSELEAIILQLPGVKDVVVVGKDGGMEVGDIPTAFVVKTEESNIIEQDVHDWLAKENLHDAKKLRGGVFFVSDIPRNTNGKLVRSKLREMFLKL